VTDTTVVDSNFLAGPDDQLVASIKKGSTLKVLFAFYRLEREAEVARGERFSASLSQLAPSTNLSYPTISQARLELVRKNAIVSYGEGVYAVPLKKVATPLPLESKRLSSRVGPRERARSREEKGVRAYKNLAGGLTHTERRTVVKDALRVLRVKDNGGKYGQLVRARLTRLLTDGHTVAEVMAVVSWARGKYDEGDRFQSLVDPMYLLSVSKFPALLAAAQTRPSPRSRELSNIDDPDTRKAWHEDYLRRVRERGLD
jgi:hypothetical protein